MIQKIGTVMGLEEFIDPDPSYVLTVDNVIKMLAIQMRFRCFMALNLAKLLAHIHLIFDTGATSQLSLWETLAVGRPVSSDTCVTC